MYKYFIFDLDGTIAYTLEDLINAMNKMLRSFGWQEMTNEGILGNINYGTVAFVRGCMPKEHQKNEKLLSEALRIYESFYAEEYIKTTRPYPFVEKAIEHYKSKGAKLAVFSNKQDERTKDICNSLFPDAFDFVLGGRNGRFPHKPSPEGALYIADLFGASPDEIAFIGDSDVDMMTAKNAGMHPIGVSWGYRPASLLTESGAEKIIYSLEDFLAL